jgi:hypothetical protein
MFDRVAQRLGEETDELQFQLKNATRLYGCSLHFLLNVAGLPARYKFSRSGVDPLYEEA